MAADIKIFPRENCIWLLRFVLITVLISGNEAKHFHSIAGPFKIVIRRIEHCPPEIESKVKIDFFIRDTRTRASRYPTYDGNLTVPFGFDDMISIQSHIASWSSMGGWKDNAHIFRLKNACRSIDAWMPLIWQTFQRSVFGEQINCPYLPGIYRFANFTLSWDSLPIKQFFYGRWRSDFQFVYPNNEVAACVRGYGDTVPV